MELVANEYLSYGEEQHSVDKLVNMTCECCRRDTAAFPICQNEQDGIFSRDKDTLNIMSLPIHSYDIESPCQ